MLPAPPRYCRIKVSGPSWLIWLGVEGEGMYALTPAEYAPSPWSP